MVSGRHPPARCAAGKARRRPLFLLRLSGLFLLRFAERQFLALLFQLPPRITRFEPQVTTPQRRRT